MSNIIVEKKQVSKLREEAEAVYEHYTSVHVDVHHPSQVEFRDLDFSTTIILKNSHGGSEVTVFLTQEELKNLHEAIAKYLSE